jgi:DNA mismatch repair protein MutS
MQNAAQGAFNDAFTPRTPLMQQYFRARAEHPGVILLMRVGDFYEAYGDDANTIAAALNITLTGREDGGERIPMAGVPHHSAERYIARLIKKGFRVAIMEQVEDPKFAKGLVKRRVTRVVSRGTVFEDSLLDAKANNYLVAAIVGDPVAGLGVADVSTGEFLTTEMDGARRAEQLIEEICRLEPAEVLVPESETELAEMIRQATGAPVTPYTARNAPRSRTAHDVLISHFQTSSLRGFGCEEYTAGLAAAALVLEYLKETQTGALAHITTLSTYSTREFMVLDASARRNLELTTSLAEGGRSRTLIGVLDETLTPMGGRLLRRWLEEPLLDVARIEARLDAVEELRGDEMLRGDARDLLRGVNDIERLVSRSAAGLANARDLVGLKDSLNRLPKLTGVMARCRSEMLAELLRQMGCGETRKWGNGNMGKRSPNDPTTQSPNHPITQSPNTIAALIERAIAPEPPAGLRDGGLIRPGYSPELDALRSAATDGRAWIANLETQERQRTGIASLKVGYNAVFGYYIEVTKANLAKVPADYIRKQTTAGGERYITPDLKEYEAKVLGADEKAVELEYSLFVDVRDRVAEASGVLLAVARAVAALDVLAGFAECAVRNSYVRPQINDGEVIAVRGGRHPVVERIQGGVSFVPNDCLLDCGENQLHIITGPNMSGKSTALRQVALITLLAQIGSFVPADEASIGVVDRIFTRVGAHDELATGQSTFMVEMNETANILNNATRRSLILLDEIGRGTSTYDGLSIAWAVAEYLAEIGCKTLFATHYHYLNDLAKQIPGVKNYRVAVKEQGDHIVWLHKLVPGGTDRSYGIQVARMAGVPPEVISRAKEVLRSLERGGARASGDILGQDTDIPTTKQKVQLTLFEGEKHPVLEDLESLDVTALTPIEAMMKLDELQRKAKQG